ncbi:MAG: hypothetical protein PHP82_03405 [Candidatus ainarchaeum sp.]|nr:hypothetical protein [Candidatus ainarchaeum sp.]
MSNPGVILLDELKNKKSFQRFQIEDNIGEGIHIHVNNFRFDLTIKEFLEFSKTIRQSLNALDILKGYSINNFDPYFLKSCSPFLKDLIDIKIEKIKLSKLKFIVHSNYFGRLNFSKVKLVSEIPAYYFLKGEKKYFLDYSQYNYFNQGNEKRLIRALNVIKKNKYPYKKQYIILFNDQNYVRDGQHRAAILAHLYGKDKEIEVMRFYFSGKKHVFHPVISNVKVILRFFFTKLINFIKNI